MFSDLLIDQLSKMMEDVPRSKIVEGLALYEKEQESKGFKVCGICGRNYKGIGNNAEPVFEGRCCDECNDCVVIPARLIFGSP